MKKTLNIMSTIIGVCVLPLYIYASYLLYKHVKATEVMWFIWWLQLPFTIIVTLISNITKTMADKEN